MLNPFKTLVIISSKSFKTRETAVNAAAIDQWLLEAGISGKDRSKHILVVSANPDAAAEMNLPSDNLFPIGIGLAGASPCGVPLVCPNAITLGSEGLS